MAAVALCVPLNRGFGDCRRLAGATDSCQGLRTLSAAQNFGAKVLSHFRVFGLHHLLVSQVLFQVGWCHKWCHKFGVTSGVTSFGLCTVLFFQGNL